MRFSFERHSTNRLLNRLLDELSDEQVSLILTGDCWKLRDTCVCRSMERFELFRRGLADVHGRLTALGIAVQTALIDDIFPICTDRCGSNSVTPNIK